MMKPMSPKTLEKKYAELGLSRDKVDLLQDYFRCFSNLYGVISVKEAWNTFKHYEGINQLHKRDFIAFSGIVQREPGHPYSVLELKEVYTGETREDPAERLIVNNRLVGTGYYKYALLYNTVDKQQDKSYYLPADKPAFLANTENRFFLSHDGKQMVRFLSWLISDGRYRDYDGEPRGDILDLDGNPVAGKCLSDFMCYTQNEQFEINYAKSEARKEKLRQEYRTTALDKVLYYIFRDIQTGGVLPNESPVEIMQFLVSFLSRDIGVQFTMGQMERFCELYTSLNNHSHLWLNRGWRPDELRQSNPSVLPDNISIGPNMKNFLKKERWIRKRLNGASKNWASSLPKNKRKS